MRIKQNDVEGHISINTNDFEGNNVLVLKHSGEETGLLSYIYHKDGILWECYTDGPLDHNLSSEIIEIEGVKFRYNSEGSQIVTTVTYLYGKQTKEMSQLTTLRSY